jgi:hypothetical protein
LPALRDIHAEPNHVVVLKNPLACAASRLRRLESSRIALLFWGLGLRRRSLALGLLKAQRYQTNKTTYDARKFAHLHFKVVGGAAPKPPRLSNACGAAI